MAWRCSHYCEQNSVPNDPKSPFVTSGIRIGTPAVTTRGFGEAEVRELAGWICDVLDARGDEAVLAATRERLPKFVTNCLFMSVMWHNIR